MKMVWPNEDFYYKHYEEIGTMITRYNQEIFNVNRDFMMSGPVIAMVWE
jgi:nucleoside diphosphate kinase